MKIHVWNHGNAFWWLDEDHFEMQNIAAGPFETREAAIADAEETDAVEITGDTPPGMVDYPDPDDALLQESKTIIAGMDAFTQQYLKTALWTGVERPDDDPDHDRDQLHDANPALVMPYALRKMVADCEKFQAEAREILEAAIATGEVAYGPNCHDEMERAGHDFWLTRNGHGAGFWDGDWPEPYAEQLTKLSKKYGEVSLFIGDDRRIGSM